MPETREFKFPKGFLWGAATSAYQVEGENQNNDWAVSDRVAKAGAACDHYRRYASDFEIAKKLNHNATRLSLEWARCEPEQGKWNEEEIHHYFHVLEFLKEQGFTTFVTLHHFTNPVWFANLGGWETKKSALYFADYVSKIAQTLGQFVDFWVTINEPSAYVYMGYKEGIWPPFERSLSKSYRVYRNMLEAHNKAYDLIHAYYPNARVGFAHNIPYIEPLRRGNPLDSLSVRLADWFNIDFTYRKTKNDFLGINQYFHNRISFPLASRWEKTQKTTDQEWPISPRALYGVLMKCKKFGLPIYITENGIADRDDSRREDYIRGYLEFVLKAIKTGVDVRGYFYWSLLDNYEWPVKKGQTGYEYKFGLVSVDFADPKLPRRIRPSARVYAKICKENMIK